MRSPEATRPAEPTVTIWVNVSTSAHWRRPPLGIVRVERRLALELKEALGHDRLRFCVWDPALGHFVPWESGWPEPDLQPQPQEGPLGSVPDGGRRAALRSIAKGLAGLAPQSLGPAFLRMRQLSRSAGGVFRNQLRRSAAQIRVGFHRDRSAGTAERDCIRAGDVLITAGLDWETGFPEVLAQLKSRIGFRVIGFCYDLIPVRYPQYAPAQVAAIFKDYIRQLTAYCDVIACTSECAEADLRQTLSDLGLTNPRLIRVRLGTDLPEDTGRPSDRVAALASQPFILYVSTIERRKNHEVVYHAMQRLAERHGRKGIPRLVFVGSIGWGVSDLLNEIGRNPLTQGLILPLQNIADADLRWLYREALFCVFPSLYEGWGMPVAEALSFGKPMICSDRGSIPEVGLDFVDYVDPWDLPGWVAAMERLWLDDDLRTGRASYIRRNYRADAWSETARPIAEAALAMDARFGQGGSAPSLPQ